MGLTALAASAAFNVQVPSTSVRPGDTVSITVDISSDTGTISQYGYTINYDATLLEYVSGGSFEYEGCISFNGVGTPEAQDFVFTALEEGTASIETAATEISDTDGEAMSVASTYNSISISSSAVSTEDTESDTSTSEEGSQSQTEISSGGDFSEDGVWIEDEIGTLTEAAAVLPEGTIVSVNTIGDTYNVLEKPDSVDVPGLYTPITIQLNDVDVLAYKKASSNSTVLLYAVNSDDHEGWYFFNLDDGTFLDADDIIGGTDSLDTFMDENKFVIMLIAIIILVILIIVVVILAVSLKGIMRDYEAEIEKLKKNNTAAGASAATNTAESADSSKNYEHAPLTIHRAPDNTPMLGDKALFPGDDEVAESYADSDYDNQVLPAAEDDYASTDDYDDSAFDSAFSDDEVKSSDSDKVSNDMKSSFDKIDEALKSADKYKK